MTNLKDKLKKIAKIWNDFIWEYKFGQSFINFNDETKTNYFGDILAYFQDTFDLLDTKNQENHHQSMIF